MKRKNFCYPVGSSEKDIITYLSQNNFDLFVTCDAAYYGHLQVLQWLNKHKNCVFDDYTCQAAAERGHIHILNWLKEHNYTWYTPLSCLCAAQKGHIEVLKWYKEHESELKESITWSPLLFIWAIEKNQKESIEWLISIKCDFDITIYDELVRTGNLKWLKWLEANQHRISNYIPIPKDDFFTVVNCKQLHIFMWLMEKGYQCRSDWLLRIIDQAILQKSFLFLHFMKTRKQNSLKIISPSLQIETSYNHLFNLFEVLKTNMYPNIIQIIQQYC